MVLLKKLTKLLMHSKDMNKLREVGRYFMVWTFTKSDRMYQEWLGREDSNQKQCLIVMPCTA